MLYRNTIIKISRYCPALIRQLLLLIIFVTGNNSGFAETAESGGNIVQTPLPHSEAASLCGKSVVPEKAIESISPADQRIHVQADTADIGEKLDCF